MDALTVLVTVAVLVVTVSMVIAVVIRGITVALGRSARRAAVSPSTPAAMVDDGRPPAAHVAAIAAAVSVVFDDVQIVRIQPSRHDVGWHASGLAAHHGSHRLGPRTQRRPGPQTGSSN